MAACNDTALCPRQAGAGCAPRASGRTACRYLWTDAFGVVLLVSLYAELGRAPVSRRGGMGGRGSRSRARAAARHSHRRSAGSRRPVLPLPCHVALCARRPWAAYSGLPRKGVELVRQIHDAFVVPGRGVIWKMKEDLSGPYPGYGFGALDAFDGYVSYRLLDEKALSREIADMRVLIDRAAPDLLITQDLGLGMMLWMTQFFPEEDWARTQRARCLGTLDQHVDRRGLFLPRARASPVKFAFTNYGVSIGLQAVIAMPERVGRLNAFFESLSFGRRIRSGGHHPCHGLQLAFSRVPDRGLRLRRTGALPSSVFVMHLRRPGLITPL